MRSGRVGWRGRQKQAWALARPPAAAAAARGDCLRPAALFRAIVQESSKRQSAPRRQAARAPGRGALCPVRPCACPRPAEQRRRTGGEEEADERTGEMKPEHAGARSLDTPVAGVVGFCVHDQFILLFLGVHEALRSPSAVAKLQTWPAPVRHETPDTGERPCLAPRPGECFLQNSKTLQDFPSH